MVEDAELLRRYTEQGSQESFAELVRRHLALVYFGALRRTADAGLAADVSQIVFVSLAKNARALRSHSALCAWLFTATRNAAINARAAEERRRKREQEALLMHETSATETASVEWDRLRPLLHEALDALSDQDRRAVLLRFFQERSFAEIGRTLRLTEDAARKRVDRALGTLETALSRRGVTSTAAAITGALTAEALAVPPVALLGTIPAAAVAAAAGSAGSVIVFVTMSKIKLGVIGAITAAGLTTVLVQIQTSRALAADLRQARTGVQRFVALQKENEILNGQLAKTTSATDRAELDRLRKQIAAVKMQPAEFDESKMRPVAEMKNAGWSTPEAAFETLFWAQNQDPNTMIDTFTRSFAFDPTTKVKADAFFTQLSPEAQAKFQTPERLFGPYAFGWGASKERIVVAQRDPIIAVQILERTNHDNDPDWLDMRFWQRSASGAGFEGRVNLTRVGNEWLQARRNPMSAEQWQRFIAPIDPHTGEARTPGK